MDMARHARLMRLATVASIITALTLIAVKVFAWVMTDSLSLLATLIDSIMDAVASLVTLVAVRISLVPADDDHRFGHGKAEYLSVLVQSAFITASALFLVYQATSRMISNEQSLANETTGIVVMVISIVATLCLVSFQRYVVQQTRSTAIAADAMHYQMDLLTNAGVILALLASTLGYHNLDNLLTMLIAAYMLINVVKLVREAIRHLMDHSLPEQQLAEIEKICLSIEGVLGVHEVRTRVSGQVPFIQLHLDLDGDLPLRTAHDIGFSAKQAILEWMPNADIIVHLDPD